MFLVLEKLKSRLEDVAETVGQSSGYLYGLIDGNRTLLLGLSVENEAKFSIDENNPAGIELIGVVDICQTSSDEDLIGRLKLIEHNRPISLEIKSPSSPLTIRTWEGGKLENSSWDVLDDADLLNEFIYVNFVATFDDPSNEIEPGSAEQAEEATEIDSSPNFIETKLIAEPPKFKIPGSEELINSNDLVEIDELVSSSKQVDDPRVPDNLTIITLETEFNDSSFLRRVEGQDGKLCNINTLILVSRQSPVNLSKLLVVSINKLLSNLKKVVTCSEDETKNCYSYCFFPKEIGYALTVIYPVNDSEEILLKKRLVLHEALGLSMASPRFTVQLALSHHFGTPPYISYSGEKHLWNVHDSAKPPKLRDVETCTVQGLYNYFHYLQDGEKDEGWGCAYRSLQTIYSWFVWQGYVDTQVPSIKEIQETLVRMKDKPESFIGSKQWIGSQEVCYILDELAKVMCRIIHVTTGKAILDERLTLLSHFQEQGTPVMVGGGQYAYTILGIAAGDSPADTRFLILDPHYVGSHDIKSILKKNGVAWKTVDMFKNSQFYNLCLPLVSRSF